MKLRQVDRATPSKVQPLTSVVQTIRRLLHDDDRGQTTIETAFGIAALVSVLLVAVSALVAVASFLAVTDAAGGIARAEARGDLSLSEELRRATGGEVQLQKNRDTVTVTVSKRVAFVPVSAKATALVEGSIAGDS